MISPTALDDSAMRALTYQVLTTVSRYAEAAIILEKPGDCALIERGGINRQLVIRCPDGCGEILSINLDARSGPAWRLYKKRNVWSLFPSIDRTSGCFSHFILWYSRVLWCSSPDEEDVDDALIATHSDRVLHILRNVQSAGFVQIADELDEIPWDILTVCRGLVQRGVLEEGTNKQRGVFFIKHSSNQ